MRLIAQIFGKLLTPKNVLTWMPKSSSFKTPSCSQRVHRSQTLLKSARRHFYPNLPLIKMNWVGKHISESDPKCWDCFLTHQRLITCILLIAERKSGKSSNAIILKTKNNFWKFYCLFEIYMKFCTFRKKRSPWQVKYFGSYWLRKICLLEYQKALLSEHTHGVNVFTGPKHCWNVHFITFILNFL